jgi:hypothetical protein
LTTDDELKFSVLNWPLSQAASFHAVNTGAFPQQWNILKLHLSMLPALMPFHNNGNNILKLYLSMLPALVPFQNNGNNILKKTN